MLLLPLKETCLLTYKQQFRVIESADFSLIIKARNKLQEIDFHQRSGGCAGAGGPRGGTTFKIRRGSIEEIPLIQGKRQWLQFAGAAVKR